MCCRELLNHQKHRPDTLLYGCPQWRHSGSQRRTHGDPERSLRRQPLNRNQTIQQKEPMTNDTLLSKSPRDKPRRQKSTGPIFRGRINERVFHAGIRSFFQTHSPGERQAIACSPGRDILPRSSRARTLLACLCIGLAFAAGRVSAAPVSDRLVKAIHAVETGGRLGAIKGDGGRALGPLQIHRAYWIDSRVPGRYEQCADLAYATKVLNAYMARYCPNGTDETIARTHNGGPRGPQKTATIRYWREVSRKMK